MNTQLIFTNDVANTLEDIVAQLRPSDVFVHVDVNTAKFVLPILDSQSEVVRNSKKIISPAGDINKNIESILSVWQTLSAQEATRKCLFINLGGGMISDLGGFAASTFKRGLSVVNIPTTLLSAVDASVGGKTGINFNGIKNQVGTFSQPFATIISTVFFQTLPQYEMLAGYAEMIKHALLKSATCLNKVLAYNVTLPPVNPDALIELLKESVLIKKEYVDLDPEENGIRKALNLGHTVAHAIEAFAMNDRKNPVSHGFAVAQGLVVESILSNMVKGFDSDTVHRLSRYIRENYGPYFITCDDYNNLIQYMRQDKKNVSASEICFTLLSEVGKPVIDVTVSQDDIRAAFDIYRDLMGI